MKPKENRAIATHQPEAGTHGGMVAVGKADDGAGYERFAAFVCDLEAMQRQGLVRIESKHFESGTGRRRADIVRFTRLK